MSLVEAVITNGKVFGVGSKGPEVREIQQRLKTKSGAVLVVDGDFGPVTESAVKRFQAQHDISVDGYVGPETVKLLVEAIEIKGEEVDVDATPSVAKSAPWLAELRAVTGVREVPGGRDSPIIMSWRGDIGRQFKDLAQYTATYTGDAIPWCGLAVARAMAVSKVMPPKTFLWALSWSKWGKRLPKPIVGCVVTFSRSGGGHVALCEGYDGDTVYIRGGNQSDMVNVVRRSMDGFVAATWPKDFPVPRTRLVGNTSNATGGSSYA